MQKRQKKSGSSQAKPYLKKEEKKTIQYKRMKKVKRSMAYVEEVGKRDKQRRWR